MCPSPGELNFQLFFSRIDVLYGLVYYFEQMNPYHSKNTSVFSVFTLCSCTAPPTVSMFESIIRCFFNRMRIAELRNDTFPRTSGFPSGSGCASPSVEVVPIDEILSEPGRSNRPPHIIIILRGLPGTGKTFLSKLIKACSLLYINTMTQYF